VGYWLVPGNVNVETIGWVIRQPLASLDQVVCIATGTFAMQTTWSNDANGCRMTHPIVTTFTFPGAGH